jgi:hypothetical protein
VSQLPNSRCNISQTPQSPNSRPGKRAASAPLDAHAARCGGCLPVGSVPVFAPCSRVVLVLLRVQRRWHHGHACVCTLLTMHAQARCAAAPPEDTLSPAAVPLRHTACSLPSSPAYLSVWTCDNLGTCSHPLGTCPPVYAAVIPDGGAVPCGWCQHVPDACHACRSTVQRSTSLTGTFR